MKTHNVMNSYEISPKTSISILCVFYWRVNKHDEIILHILKIFEKELFPSYFPIKYPRVPITFKAQTNQKGNQFPLRRIEREREYFTSA